MKNILCLLGNHVYSDASAEMNAVDERDGYLICRVKNCCLRCGEPYEDIVQIPIPKWLCKKREGEEEDTERGMSREEAIRKLKKQKAEYLEKWIDFSGVAEAYDMAIEALEQPKQEWIPVTESLPKNDDWVIVTILDESGDTPWRYTDFGWYLEAASCWIVEAEQRTDVTAWMSLPEPWKGEER